MNKNNNRARYLFFLLLLTVFMTALAQVSGLRIGNYVLVSKTRISVLEYRLTYKADLINGSTTNITSATAKLSPIFNLLTTDNQLSFGSVASGKSVTSTDTFTLRWPVFNPVSPKILEKVLVWRISTTNNAAPIANAGPDQTVSLGSTASLDGSASSDLDGDTLTYQWSITTKPTDSVATLTNPTSATPNFVVDKSGQYTVRLVVNDGKVSSSADIVIISTLSSAPTANAGADQTVFVNETVTLDGTGSTDVDGNPLTYRWSITSSPTGSGATLTNPTTAHPTFTVDKPGDYAIQLIVNDGTIDSAVDSVTVSTQNSAPIANAGVDQSVAFNSLVTLDGSASKDVDQNPLTYRWSIISKPPLSAAELTNNTTVSPTFTADKAGSYTVQLIVNDGTVDSQPDQVIISTQNTRPVANAGADQMVNTGSLVNLNGNGSTDAEGDTLTYQWSLLSSPTGSVADLVDAQSATPSFTPLIVGEYITQLIVNDGQLASEPDTVQINVTATTPNNQLPQITSTPVTTATVGTAYSYDVNATDADVGDTLTYALQTAPTGMVIDPSTGIIQWAPITAQVGNQDVNVQVQDNHGAATSQSFSIIVTAASIAIPDVTSKTQDAAAADILAAGLTVGTITTINSDTVPSGAVISQTPVAGTKVPNGASVNLVISLGPSGNTDAPFEKGASIIGKVVNAGGTALSGASFTVFDERATGTPRPDVSVGTGTDGSFRLKLTSFPQTEPARSPAHHLIVVIDAPGTLRAYREAYAHPGDTADIGTIKLIARDPQITNIGPAGGTAQDSQGLMEVVIPPGALTTTIPVQITPLKERDQFPAPLPDSTLTMYGFILEPHGTQFQVPVTVRTANYRNLPTDIELPSGYYNEVENRWEHAGTAKWDGSRFASQTTHFSSFDHNATRDEDLVLTISKSNNPNQGENMCGVGSSWSPGGGAIEQRINLPSTHIRGEDFSVSLHYSSGLAGSRKLGDGDKTTVGAIPYSGIGVSVSGTKVSMSCVAKGSGGGSGGGTPGQCSSVVGSCGGGGMVMNGLFNLLGGQNNVLKDTAANATEASFGNWLELPLNDAGEVPPSGLFTQQLNISFGAAGSCAGSGGTFGVRDPLAKKVQLSTPDTSSWGKVPQKVFVQHRINSPFGAGWAVQEISRVYSSDDKAVLVHGNGQEENFSPRGFPKKLVNLPQSGRIILARDSKTGEIILANNSGVIALINPDTGVTSTILSGLPFSAGVDSMAVAYVGNQRHFVVALDNQLVDVNGGSVRNIDIPTFTTNINPFQQPSVAAHNDVVFYTNGIESTLYKLKLSDPTPVLQPVSRATGGDIGLYPKGTVSTVTFGTPHGVAFGANGTLYMADVRRNAVYSLIPAANGEVGPDSQIQLVAGDGVGAFLMSPGEHVPAPTFPIREPLGVSIGGDGIIFLTTTYGIANYDPVSHEATWLMHWGNNQNIGEFSFTRPDQILSFIGLNASSMMFATSFTGDVVQMKIERLSSERDPTRNITKLTGGEFELTDSTQAKVWKYDTIGRLIEQRKRTSETDFTVSYVDAQSERIDRMTNAVGGQTVFNYTGGKLNSITDPSGRVTQFNVNGNGDLVSLKQPDNETYNFVYDGHRMTDKTAPSGDVTQYTYAANGTASSSTKPGGETYSFQASLAKSSSYDANGKEIFTGAYTDARGILHEFQTNGFGEIEKENYTADGVAYARQQVYVTDLFGPDEEIPELGRKNTLLRTSHATLNGVPLSPPLTFDSLGRTVQQVHFLGGVGAASSEIMHRWTYDADGWLLQAYKGISNTAQRIERDSAGHVLRIFDVTFGGKPFVATSPQPLDGPATGREMKFTWRPDGQLATSTAHGVTTAYNYDDANGTLNLKGLSDTTGRTMSFTYDGQGNLASASDGTSLASFVHDANNRMTKALDALGNVTEFEYARTACGCSEDDLVTGIHTPDLAPNVKWQLAYGPQGRLASLTDPLGFTESYTYEPTGELASQTDRLGRLTSMNYDHLGRLLSQDDALGRKHQRSYTVPQSGAWAGPTLTAASADVNAAPIGLTDSLKAGDYQIGLNAYDEQGFPAKISFYRDATFALGYSHYFDSGMRLTQRVDRTAEAFGSATVPLPPGPGTVAKAQFAYEINSPESLVRLEVNLSPVSADSSDFTRNLEHDTTIAMGYGGGAVSPPATYTYTRDVAGRATGLSRHFIIAQGASTLDSPSTYTYRPDGRVGQVVNIDGDHNFTYDERGLVKTQTILGEGTYSYQYDEMGRNSLLEFPDGHVRRQQYDLLGRINQRCYEYANTTLNRCYGAEYDAEGNPVKLTDPEGEDRIEYDALDRIAKVTRVNNGVDGKVDTYAYNALGALKTNAGIALDHQRPRLDGAGSADATVPNALNGQPITLDKGGRVTTLAGTGFTWGLQNHLVTVTETAPAAPINIKYDAYHRRVQRLQGSDQEVYVYEGNDRIATINVSTRLPKETYLFDGDRPSVAYETRHRYGLL